MKKYGVIKKILEEVRNSGESRFKLTSGFVQHGNTSVMKHCIAVAYVSVIIAKKLHIKVDMKALIRGALLHDYFLYDWHEKLLRNQIHGFTHPKTALQEALKDFTLSKREENMILHHMFPLTPCPPKYREGWLLCLADKICATRETINRR